MNIGTLWDPVTHGWPPPATSIPATIIISWNQERSPRCRFLDTDTPDFFTGICWSMIDQENTDINWGVAG